MRVNAIFDNVKVYDVQSRLDVVTGQEFQLEILEADPMPEIFTSKDPILSIGDDNKTVTASKVGESTIRLMTDTTVVKDILIAVVDATHPNATTLNGTLGEPIPK